VEVVPHRLAEVAAMLPILHARPGGLVVGAAGPMAEGMALEALRWRDVSRVLVLRPLPKVHDRRVEVVKALPAAGVDVLCLSAEQSPRSFLQAVSQDGVVQTMTAVPSRLAEWRDRLKDAGYAHMPWRDHLPQCVWGLLGKNTRDRKIPRMRKPPAGARHLSEQFLPCLFTFARDELPVAFTRRDDRLDCPRRV
jgi:hypothetical protein